MSKALKDLVSNTAPLARASSPSGSLEENALDYARCKVQVEQLELQMAKLKKKLTEGLGKLAEPQVAVTFQNAKGLEVEKFLYLCPTASKSFDLEAAKETLSKAEMKKLEPFIKVTESFELKAAENLLDMTKLQKFIDVKEAVQLRFKDVKETEGEE